jgi:organic hydroperoxide reductase OsmC/OhrA
MTLEDVLYTARAHTTGGRNGGDPHTDDGRLDVNLSSPGGPGAAPAATPASALLRTMAPMQ